MKLNLQMFADAGTLVNASGSYVNAYTGQETEFPARAVVDFLPFEAPLRLPAAVPAMPIYHSIFLIITRFLTKQSSL